MRYASFFSGIEMASVAFKPLGWTPVAFAEVDPFASAVLAHHYPHVPNLGDVTAITEDTLAALGQIDLIIMGFPCQDVSSAGKRRGLVNSDGTPTRTGLFFDAMRLVRAAHRRCGLRWLIGENVPGLYSSNAGRDFAAVVGEIVGCAFDVPGAGWQDTGAAAGPRGMVEWRLLDAQWYALAQRRERVFFVGDFGAWADRAPVLLEPESLQGNPPPCVEARQRPAARPARRAYRESIWRQIAQAFRRGNAARPADLAGAIDAASGRGGADDNDARSGRLIAEVAGTLSAGGKAAGSATGQDALAGLLVPVAFGGNDTSGPREIATCLNAKGGSSRMDFESETFIAHTLTGSGFDASEDGSGRGTPIIPLFASGHCGANGAGIGREGDPMMTLDTSGAAAIAFHARQDPDCDGEVTHPLDTDDRTIGIAFDTTQITSPENRANPQPGDACHPLSAQGHPPAYATHYEVRRITPTEAERLMGVPDGYTNIPYRGAAHAADGPRYKALGNGFAVPVVRWIGQRIEKACAGS